MHLHYVSLQYLAKKLGFDTLWFGYLQTTVGVIQLVRGPMFGRRVQRKKVSVAATFTDVHGGYS